MSFNERMATALAAIGIVLGTLSGCVDERVRHVRLASNLTRRSRSVTDVE